MNEEDDEDDDFVGLEALIRFLTAKKDIELLIEEKKENKWGLMKHMGMAHQWLDKRQKLFVLGKVAGT